jgi:hypothetical protein
MIKQILVAAALGLACFTAPDVQAGSTAAANSVLPKAQVAQFSDRVQKVLASNGAQVAIVSRMGRDPSTMPDGIKYTHVAFWVFSEIKLADGSTGTGYRAYNLYQDGQKSSRSYLMQDRPSDFFAGAQRLDTGVIIPDKRLQKKLLAVIASPTFKALHNRRYSVLSNPNTAQFQNCTEHMMDVMMAALYGTRDKSQIKANMAAHFEPSVIKVSAEKRAWAPVLSQALTTRDHGEQIKTATFGSIANFMKEHKLAVKVLRITPRNVARY